MNTMLPWTNPELQSCVYIDSICCKRPISGQFFQYSLDLAGLRVVFNYLKRVGPVHVFKKIQSRFFESSRNEKYFLIGFGYKFPTSSGFEPQPVFFIHTSASPQERYLSVENSLIFPVDFVPDFSSASLSSSEAIFDKLFEHLAGWSPYSGSSFDSESVRYSVSNLIDSIRCTSEKIICDSDLQTVQNVFSLAALNHSISEYTGPNSVVLFGLGNYAKTNILPNIKPLSCTRIHEIDFSQLSTARRYVGNFCSFSSSPIPDFDGFYKAWFIAGYHHTHADLAVQAIKVGSIPVIEKPLFTSMAQCSSFTDAIDVNPLSFFVCFHKRYSLLHHWFISDLFRLGINYDNSAFDMHCIVHEVPLPDLHWYRWPNSGSRVISNGCHWLDYFMFINSYSPVESFSIISYRGDNISSTVSLSNGATLSFVLTDEGSSRVGVRDYIEIRSGLNTFKMIDSCQYQLETSSRIYSVKRTNPLSVYATMYSAISKRISMGLPGDSRDSLRSSMLALELDATINS